MIRAVLFDVGECLIDETRLWAGWADWLGVPRHTFSAVFGAVLARAGVPETYDEDDLFPDARPTLAALRRAGLWIGVVGNQPAALGAALRALDLPADLVAASDEWGVRKPDPAFFTRVAEAAPCTATEVLYVGDRLDNDIRPAAAAGLWTALIRRGPWALLQQDDPDAARLPTFRIDTLTALPGCIARANATPA